jgi:hypothetical protein
MATVHSAGCALGKQNPLFLDSPNAARNHETNVRIGMEFRSAAHNLDKVRMHAFELLFRGRIDNHF